MSRVRILIWLDVRVESIRLRLSKNWIKLRLAQVVLLFAQGMKAAEIVQATYLHVENIRKLIRRFNAEGLSLMKECHKSGPSDCFYNREIRVETVGGALCPP